VSSESPRPASGGKLRLLWRDIVLALRGNDEDFTSGSMGRAILILSIPMILEMLMESVFAVVDIFFVSRLGPEAIATVGITESMLTVIYAVAFGLSMGATAMIARRIGEKRHEDAAVAAVQALAVAVLVSIPVAVVGIFFAPQLLGLMGMNADAIKAFSSYTAIMLGGNIVIMLIFVGNAVYRGAGDATIAMRVLWLANGINIVLDPCLIFGWGPFPELGIAGAAVATTIGRGIGVTYQLWTLGRAGARIRLSRSDLRFVPAVMKRLVRVSAGGIGQFIIATTSWIGLVRIMATFGSISLAGYTIAIRIIIFAILPSWGMANAAATLVGQNLGAGKPDRAERSVWLSSLANMAFLGIVASAFIVFAEFFIGLFTKDAGIITVGADCLRILSYGYVLYALGMVVIQAFNGAGDTTTPTIINVFSFWLFELPLAYVLSLSLGLNERGVFFAIIIAESLMTIAAVIVFRRGKWKTREV